MKLYGAIVVYNEEPIVKYVMPYLMRYGFDKLYIYDDGSTDGTIDLIKSYNCDFIEFRDFSAYREMDKMFDMCKAQMYIDLFLDGKKESEETGDDVWVYHSDFDEVLFYYDEELTLKSFIENNFDFHCNYYCNRMVNLICGDDCVDMEKEGKLPHMAQGTKCFYWNYWGQKVVLLKCNDFKRTNLRFGCGNHFLNICVEDGKEPKNLENVKLVYSFHLKYFNYEYYAYKNNKNKGRGLFYYDGCEYLKKSYENKISVSFPIEMFYALYGFFNNELPRFEWGGQIIGDLNINN